MLAVSSRCLGALLPLVALAGCANPSDATDTDAGSGGDAAGATAGRPAAGGGIGGATTAAGSGGSGVAGSASGASAGGTAGSGVSGGAAGTGGGVDACAPTGVEVALPLAVDDHFVPSGYFAGPDAAANLPGITEAGCATRPDNPAGHVGKCHQFSFQAVMTGGNPPAAWGGVFWQAPADNWGDFPGIRVQSGATRVRFRAWGAAGGEVVGFNVGGIGRDLGPCRDGVDRGASSDVMFTLTTTPTDYEVSLADETYAGGVIGAFVWSLATSSTAEQVQFFVDDIQWVE